MAQTALRKMGNSTGMIVPRSILGEIGVGIGASLDLRVEDGKLIVTPIRKVREGWAEDAEKIAALPLTEEERDWADFGNTIDESEAKDWTW